MKTISRREFLRYTALGGAALAASPIYSGFNRVFARALRSRALVPYPHSWMPKMDFVYLADENEDPFKSQVSITQDGIEVPEDLGSKKYSINARWFVEGFGYIWLSADNGGEFFTSAEFQPQGSLNFEFARSRVVRNRKVRSSYEKEGAVFSSEVKHLTAASEELLEDAGKKIRDGEKSARLADKSLEYALWAGEKIELEKAALEIEKKSRNNVAFGCESRQYVWAKSEEFTKRFVELFNFATVTHYVWDSWYELFEPREGHYNWGIKDDIVNWLLENDVTIQGRPLFWFHPTVTPDWLKNKNFDELKKYVEKHTEDLVSHYGDKVLQWEVVNEYHDWANVHNHTPEEITEIVRLACNKTKETNPKVVKILNNCCPWAEYAARGRMARMDATRPLRSPRKYLEDITQAGVDYDVLGIQIYFPARDLSDIVRLLERLEKFGKPIYITEIGASAGPTNKMVASGDMKVADGPYEWHRHWDEELQADWLEQVYNLYYSRPLVKAVNWYDFSDFRPFIPSGGLVREDSTPKLSFFRMKGLLNAWGKLPRGSKI
ncbi:MAG: twin-arginine translocation signal domain-containing protein [Ignavibacteria bacterium]|nr:twin-arginine translocation signal domain-containing protein [Ignavibacteria bacterium]MCU7505006.1 twin-arginine translocation signal domain-containing protein [Ignavibacteria bacterium]MCU7514860.1 twin-arginine translocation signal domain-containing protein [Ignavibacteria bacterium]